MATRVAVQAPTEAELADAEVERILDLAITGWVREARAAVAEATQRFPDHGRVRQLAELLEPPKAYARDGGTRMDLRGQIAWLKAHAIEYPGQWLALRGDKLLGADASRVALHRRLEREDALDGAVFFFMPEAYP